MAASLHLPGPAIGQDTPIFGSDDITAKLPFDEQYLSYGVVPGLNVREVAITPAGSAHVVAAGAPGTLTVDFSGLVSLNGTALSGIAGKIVYLYVLVLTGSDLRVRRSAANPIALLSGVTDTLDLQGCAELIRIRNNGALTNFTGIAFDATHKNLDFESTGGATFRLIAGVI
jgi:hypothetical protein